jgi:hypothetical protein
MYEFQQRVFIYNAFAEFLSWKNVTRTFVKKQSVISIVVLEENTQTGGKSLDQGFSVEQA